LWLRGGIIVAQSKTRKEKNMSKEKRKIKVHISLSTEIYEKGKDLADEMGIPFSTYLSVLIAKDVTRNEIKKH
jgi:predicted DNA binding CopG/RHH family protein